ncbi:hypothetical protein [Actinoplanes sp. NPDC026619]|uniref:hypothetical protein n=1 Tax=Actinoplanes sp. NPDC026619 TaxID=3155798 RepID=UPI0033DCEA69
MTVTDWLLDGDPAIRWQVMRDLVGAPADEVTAERARVNREGWGARLLGLQEADGQWAGGAFFPREGWNREAGEGQPWTATEPVLTLLRTLGATLPADRVQQVADNCRWENDNQPFFAGETEPCINGRVVALGVYFEQDVEAVVERLLSEQLTDGGWNCEAGFTSTRSSFDTTINVLEGLKAYEEAGGAEVTEARLRGEEYLLDRQLFRRLSTGDVIKPDYLLLAFPGRWHYDVLRALDYFRGSGDPRLAEARQLVWDKQQPDGTWVLEHTYPGRVHFVMEQDGKPSRWNTLRALRALQPESTTSFERPASGGPAS